MKSNYLSKNTINDLQKLIGAQVHSIYFEGGRIVKAENMILEGHGMISITAHNRIANYKWRLKFHEETAGEFYSEFYQWETPPSFKERYNTNTSEVNYDQDTNEDFKKYPVSIEISPKENEDIELSNKIKIIRIYHYEGEFDNGGESDYVALIDIETESGRRIIIEEDDPKDTFYIHVDDLTTLNYRLVEIHDDPGKTFGKNRYQLRHEITW